MSDVERLSLVGRLSGGFDRCAHKPHGGPLPTSPLQLQVPGTQRGMPVPSGADTDIPLVGAGPGGPSKHATTPPIWGLPGALGASAPPQSTAARRPRVFYWGEARGLMPGGRGPQTPRRPSVIRLFSSARPFRGAQVMALPLPGLLLKLLVGIRHRCLCAAVLFRRDNYWWCYDSWHCAHFPPCAASAAAPRGRSPARTFHEHFHRKL